MATKSTAAKPASNNASDERIAELEGTVAELKQLLAAALANQTQREVNIVAPSTDVVLVYCSDCLGHLHTAHLDLDFNRWGEQFTLSRSQFDEVVGSYRRWFDEGILAVSGDTEEGIRIAASKGIKTHNEFYLDANKLESIGKMTVNELEDLWEKTKVPNHRLSIVTFFKRKFIENDPAYRDRAKVDLLNRLTNGGFAREQDELSGRIKISPLNMMRTVS